MDHFSVKSPGLDKFILDQFQTDGLKSINGDIISIKFEQTIGNDNLMMVIMWGLTVSFTYSRNAATNSLTIGLDSSILECKQQHPFGFR